MTRPFRLAGLLRLRRMQEELAAADLARANAAREAAARRRHQSTEALAGFVLPEAGDDLTWTAAVAARAALGGLATECTAALRAADAVADRAAQEWMAARTLATTLEKLEERYTAMVRQAENDAEQLALDETAGRRHGAPPTGPGDDTTTEEPR